jgi:hypothetical protein
MDQFEGNAKEWIKPIEPEEPSMVDAVISCLLAGTRRRAVSYQAPLMLCIPVNRLSSVHPIP